MERVGLPNSVLPRIQWVLGEFQGVQNRERINAKFMLLVPFLRVSA